MLHPFSEDTKDLTVSELQEKLSDLSKKYFQTHNPQVKTTKTKEHEQTRSPGIV